MTQKYSQHPEIHALIERFLGDLCPFLEKQAREISDLTAIGKALGTGKDIHTLLEMILSIARRLTHADGGTLYLVDKKNRYLTFHVMFNDSLNIKESGTTTRMPHVNLYLEDGSPNLSNISSHAYHTGEIVNIRDVYQTRVFQFDGTRKFDRALNYKSRSMVVIPMKNHEDRIIGILQLINAIEPASKKIIPFGRDVQEKAAALANQASVILTQQKLIHEMKDLFEAFIQAIAVSIDEKSKHTGGHVQRVTELCLLIAEQINRDQTDFKDVYLTEEQIDELRIAALMHDTGKITTPDHIINKATRLETVYDRFELIKTRWDLFKINKKLKAAQAKLAILDPSAASNRHVTHNRQTKRQFLRIDQECQRQIDKLDRQLSCLSKINTSRSGLSDDQLHELTDIYNQSETVFDKRTPYLTPGEYEFLSVAKGTLTSEERSIVNSHASITEKMLSKLPWPQKLSNVPVIAGAHHEKLDGTGYPKQRNKADLNLQARILAISDIFEALSARDRPYKKPLSLSQTRIILEKMGEKGLLDNRIITLLFSTQIHQTYARTHLCGDQMDL